MHRPVSLMKKAMFWPSKADHKDSKKCALCLESFNHEKKKNGEMIKMKTCSHRSCYSCLYKWMERLELSGNDNDTPSCPFCRQEMDPEDVIRVMGRPFQPCAATTSAAANHAVIDVLTQDWLLVHTKPCPHCGAQIMKAEETSDLMECLCGYRFCFACGSSNAECTCTPGNHLYFDNVLRTIAPDCRRSAKQEIAPMDEQTGEVHLVSYMEKKKATAKMERSAERARITERPDCEASILLAPSNICTSQEEEALQDNQANLILFENMALVRSWQERNKGQGRLAAPNWKTCLPTGSDHASISTCSEPQIDVQIEIGLTEDEQNLFGDNDFKEVSHNPWVYNSTKQNHKDAMKKCSMHLFGFH